MEAVFNTRIYSKKALSATIEAYAQLASFELTHEGEYYVVRVAELHDPEVKDRLIDEFSNYALYRTIAEKKQWQ